MGVRYYLAQSDLAIDAARNNPYLEQVAEAQPFVVFEVARSELVEALPFEPVVASGRSAEELAGEFGDESEISRFEVDWVSQAVEYYNNPVAFGPVPAEDGPEEWIRLSTLESEAARIVDPVQITIPEDGIETNKISFSVDQVGVPVLVKISYFPNWKADGADGPWRAGPNLMVVVPTENDVTLSYGRTVVDLGSQFLTILGFGGLWALAGIDRRRWGVMERLGLGSGPLLPGVGGGSNDPLAPDAGPAAAVDMPDVGSQTILEPSDGSGQPAVHHQPAANDQPGVLEQPAVQAQPGEPAAPPQNEGVADTSAADSESESDQEQPDSPGTVLLGPAGEATTTIELADNVEAHLDETLDRQLQQPSAPTTDPAIEVEQPPTEGGGSPGA
jgi:hypothetical protein